MPDVGVLQLKISADAGNATRSLTRLQTRLSELSEVAQSFNLSNVATQIGDIVKHVSSKEGANTAAKNLGTLLNAITAFSKVKSIGLSADQVKQISDLKEAVSGFTLGNSGTQLNKLREALGGTWDTAQAGKAREALETLADGAKTLNTSGTAEKIKDVSSSLDNITGVSTKGVSEATDEIVDYQKVVNELGDTLKNAQVTFKEPLMGLNLQQFGGGSTSIPKFENASVQNWRDEMAGIRGVNDELKKIDTTSINNISDLQRALSELGKIKGAAGLQRFANGVNKITAAIKKSGDSYLTLGRLASAISRFKEVTNGFSVPSFARLESLARTLQENFNVENELKRLAEGITAFKTAIAGLDLAAARSIAAAIRSINTSAGETGGSSTAMEQFSASIRAASGEDALNGFAETSERIANVSESARNAYDTMEQLNTIIQQTGWSAQSTAEQFSAMFNAWNTLRMSMSLEAGTNPLLLGDGTGGSGAGWTYWKDGAIEVEGTVSDAMETIRIEAGQTIPLLMGVSEEASSIGDDFGNSQDAMDNMQHSAQSISDSIDSIRDGFGSVTSEVDNTKSHVDELGDAAIAFARQWNDSEPKAKYNGEESESIAYINNLIETASKADLVAMRMDALRDKMYALASSENANGDQLARMVAQYRKLEEEFNSLTTPVEETKKSFSEIIEQFSELMFGAEGLQGSFKKMFPTISGLANRFQSLIKYRVLRSIIKQISEGFQEGTENYYYYSQVVGGSFATNMDNAASSLSQMKNSIGAAAAPLINSLIPYLQTAVNWFIELINHVNQFIALLNGQSTWSRATAVSTKAFDDISDSASGASDSISDLLADWDELNIIQNESSGSGSGAGTSTSGDYASMFEEVSEYEGWIKDTVEWIQEHMNSILGIATAIGVAILAWKVSNAFSGLVGDLASLVLNGAMIAIGLQVTYEGAYAAGYNGGFDAVTFIATAGGILTTTIGAALIGYKFGGTWGAVIGGAAGFIASIATAIYAYDAGERRRIEESKWGSIHYTAEQIEEYARSQFTFDIDAQIEVMNAFVTNSYQARNKVAYAIDEFKNSLRKLDLYSVDTEINVDTEKGQQKIQALKDAAEDAQATITAIKELIDTNEEGIEFTLTNFKFVDSEGKDISGELLNSIKLADQTLKDYFTGIGTDIAKWIYEGEQSGWANGEYQMALELMQSQERILDNAEELKNQKLYDLTTESNVNQAKNAFAVQDYDTAKGIVEAEQTRYEDYYNAAIASVEEQKQNLIYFASLATSAADEMEEQLENETDAGKRADMKTQIDSLRDAATNYENAAKEIIEKFDEKVELEMQGSKEKQKNAWLAMLQEVYGNDYSSVLFGSTDQGGSWFEWLDDLFGVGHDTESVIQRGLEESGIDGAAQEMYNYLVNSIRGIDTTGATDFFIDTLGGNLYDLIKNNTDLVQDIADGLVANTENKQMAYDIFKAMFGLDDETTSKYIKTWAQEVGFEAAKEVQEQSAQTDYFNSTFKFDGSGGVEIVDKESVENAKETVTAAADEAKESLNDVSNTQIHIAEPIVTGIETGFDIEFDIPEMEEDVDIWDVCGIPKEGLEVPVRFVGMKDEEEVDIEDLIGSTQSTGGNWFNASFSSLWNSAIENATNALNQAFGENSMFGTITINTERNDEQDTNNIAEGTKRGNVGLEAKLGQLNSTMSQLNGNVVNIATKIGGGLTNLGASATGSLINNALNAFNMVKG